MKKFLLGLAAGLALVMGVALADVYYGYNPSTGLEVTHGVDVSGGNLSPVTGTAGCGTLTAKAGGASAGTVTLGTFATSCALTITIPAAAPNGVICSFYDLTTPADSANITQASTTTTTCVSHAGTVVTGDVIVWTAEGF